MNSNFRRFDSLSWPEAEKASKIEGSTLIWPFGALEQHGPHLPLSTDSLFAERILLEVLQGLPKSFPIWMLPSQSIGFSPEHSSFPGTISFSANLLLDLVSQVGEQVSSMGFDRLVLFNGHGGQIGLLQSAARQLRAKTPSLAVLPCFLWSGVSIEGLVKQKEIEVGLHAGLAETSLMLALEPGLVGPQRVADGEHMLRGSVTTPPKGWSLEGAAPCAWITNELSSSGVIGDNRDANPSTGRALRDALVQYWTSLLTSLMESNWPPTK